VTTYARTERLALADLLEQVGPHAPTLCAGWDTADLAAHIVVRESRPDAALGIVVPAAAAHGDAVRATVAARPWRELVAAVRSGPPAWNPMRLQVLDREANTVEFFVHHEDVRRAGAQWEPRALAGAQADLLWHHLRRQARLAMRAAPVAVRLVRADAGPAGAEVTVGRKHADVGQVEVRGDAGELLLFAVGRGSHARVERRGDDAALTALAAARLGL